MSGNPVRYLNVRKTLTHRLIAHSTRSIEAYRNEHGNVGYVGGGSNPGLLRAAAVCIGDDAEVITDRARSAIANPLEPDAVRSPGTEAAAKAARAALHLPQASCPMRDAPTPPIGALDVRVEDRRLTVTSHGPHGPVTTCVSNGATWAVYRMLGRHLETGKFDSRG